MPIDTEAPAREMLPQIIAWRRDIHQHPELGMQERRTTHLVAAELDRLRCQVERPLETGGVGMIEPRGKPTETIAFRADLDALPLDEGNPDLPYRSETAGACHACGHDAHTAMLLGAALFADLALNA
jgi:amidohydrolase